TLGAVARMACARDRGGSRRRARRARPPRCLGPRHAPERDHEREARRSPRRRGTAHGSDGRVDQSVGNARTCAAGAAGSRRSRREAARRAERGDTMMRSQSLRAALASVYGAMTLLAVAVSVAIAAQIVRGPYLQIGRPDGVTIRWRTDVATNSRVRW